MAGGTIHESCREALAQRLDLLRDDIEAAIKAGAFDDAVRDRARTIEVDEMDRHYESQGGPNP